MAMTPAMFACETTTSLETGTSESTSRKPPTPSPTFSIRAHPARIVCPQDPLTATTISTTPAAAPSAVTSALACECLPEGSFWEYSVDPLYTSSTAGDPDLYCLGAPALIDGGDDLVFYDLNGDLVSYDLNGDVPGDFNGSGPDIGSREDGPGDCN